MGESDQFANEAFNQEFTLEEVGNIVKKSKRNKAPGNDSIIYDALKNDNAISMLHALFKYKIQIQNTK